VQAVWYHSNPDVANQLTIQALKTYSDHVLVVSRGVEAGGEQEIEKLLKIIIDSYVPGAEKGFCVGYGMVTSVPGQNEQAGMSLTDKSLLGFDITFDTHTVREPERTDPLEDIEHDKKAFAAAGHAITVLHNKQRLAADLTGMEGWLSVRTSDNKAILRFSWSYAGTPGSAGAPAIMIVGTASTKDHVELEAAWDELLKSLRTIPFADEATR
jgi:hypothetical protein